MPIEAENSNGESLREAMEEIITVDYASYDNIE